MEAAVTFAPRVGPHRLTFNPRVVLECKDDHVVWRADPVHLFVDTRLPIQIAAIMKGPVKPSVCCLSGSIDVQNVTPCSPTSQTLIQGAYVWEVHATATGDPINDAADFVTVTITGYAPRAHREATHYLTAVQLMSLSQQTCE